MSKDIVFKPDQIGNVDSIEEAILKRFKIRNGQNLYISKSYIDARKKDDVKIVYRVDALTNKELSAIKIQDDDYALPYLHNSFDTDNRPIIVGFGPAGMYAALVLSYYGLKPIVIERGSNVDKRTEDIEKVRKGEDVNTNSNVQFGEGGAGTFSDGKLNTGVNSNLKNFISDIMVKHGACKTIMYDNHPHVGTDVLRKVVKGIREEIISYGGEVLFDTTVEDLIITDSVIKGVRTNRGDFYSSNVILAIGHSSRDTVRKLYDTKVVMESKPFSVGVRIEHLRSSIDISQYGFDTSKYKNISAANYKLAVDTSLGKKLYTFCMCPGGEVVAAQSTSKSICTNGMSYSARDLTNSNSALLVPVDANDYGTGTLDGIYYQEKIENYAFVAAGSNRTAPITAYKGLMNGGASGNEIIPSFKPGTSVADFREIFDIDTLSVINEGISNMGRKIKGFDNPESILTGVEARSSSPVRILRDKDSLMSVNVYGLYPCGEGAGYAGGIMSSAIDGIKCANALAKSMLN